MILAPDEYHAINPPRTEFVVPTLECKELKARAEQAEAKLRKLSEAISEVNLFFQSGNNIQVEKATITQEQWRPVQAALKAAIGDLYENN